MELTADPVADVLPDHREPGRLRRFLHGVADVAQPVARPALIDGGVKAPSVTSSSSSACWLDLPTGNVQAESRGNPRRTPRRRAR